MPSAIATLTLLLALLATRAHASDEPSPLGLDDEGNVHPKVYASFRKVCGSYIELHEIETRSEQVKAYGAEFTGAICQRTFGACFPEVAALNPKVGRSYVRAKEATTKIARIQLEIGLTVNRRVPGALSSDEIETLDRLYRHARWEEARAKEVW